MIRFAARRLRGAPLIAALLPLCAGASAAAETESAPRPSIAWKEFGAPAFEQARKEGKLVILSIQAPWGHWDRVMNETSYADPRIARLVNDRFIAIKADPLVRPDLYARYGMGGWPTTAFLLPSGHPFFFPDASHKVVKAGGSYYAPDVLLAYLEELSSYYAANKDSADKAGREIMDGILQRKEIGEGKLTRDMLEVATTRFLEAYVGIPHDPTRKMGRHPDLDSIELAFYYYRLKGNRDVLDIALHLLTEMARGGIRDHLGGGFHRSAADAAWRVPAFEKLLSVNAEMLQAYTHVYKLTGNGVYLGIADGIADYVTGTLADPGGWFYAYQAADARSGEDGDHYTWTLEEARAALDDEEEAIVVSAYDLGELGEMVDTAPRRNVLFVQEGPKVLSERLGMEEDKVAALLETGRRKLLAARAARPVPDTGRVLITEANAAIGASLLLAGDARGREERRTAGLRAIDAAWEKARDPRSGLMDRAWTPEGGRSGHAELFADQAAMVRALVAAHESTGRAEYLDRARQLAEAAGKAFADSFEGGWMDRIYEADAPGLASWPLRSIRDNALFAESLIRLRYLTGEAEDGPLVRAAQTALESWADEYARYKEAAAPYALAVEKALTPPLEVVIAGSPADEGYDAVEVKVRALYHPWKMVRRVPRGDAALAARGAAPAEGAASYLCSGARCAGPYTGQDDLRERLAAFLSGKEPSAGPDGAGEKRPEGER
ncbi:MAG TPA: DUF255 domain-containing protein [Candidatus Polarisedimenticolia bacterium]|nr:DUF255 domain-containing protein [Candidatus Polarisedimenticolia bacterium]